jgi:hypothetical protein
MSENIYDILARLSRNTPTSSEEVEPLYESVDPQAELIESVQILNEKFNKFNPRDEDEAKYLNPQAKRFVQLAKAKFPETSSDLEAVVAAIGDKTEDLDKRDRETAEWISKAKATIDQQQREIEQTEQAVTDANARYDAQEKRFQEFNRQVAAAELDVQQQAQAALDYAKQPDAQPQAVIQQVQAQEPQEIEPEAPTVVQTPATAEPQATTANGTDKTPAPKKEPAGEKKTTPKKKADVISIKSRQPFQEVPTDQLDAFVGSPMTTNPKKVSGSDINEAVQMIYPEGSPALGQYNLEKIKKAYIQKLPRVDLIFGDSAEKLTDADIYAIVAWFYLKSKQNADLLPNLAARNLSTQKDVQRLLKTDMVNHYRSRWDTVKRSEIQKKAAQVNAQPLDFNAPKPAPQTPPADDKYTQQPIQPKKGQLNLFNGKQSMKTTKPLEESLIERFMKFKEDAKPDFLDLDKDGDTDEPMKKAAKDAKDEEPSKPDADAVAKRKRLQALKDKQEDERAEKDDYDSKSSSRVVKGRAYGGAAQKDDEDKDDLDEVSYSAKAARAGKDIGKPGKAFAKIAKDAAKRYGSKERGEKVAGAVLAKLRHGEELDEVAPPGAKAERMVKHIKKGYAKDGKLTPKEKGIAFATAWKAKKAGKLEESRNAESSEYTYETIGRILCDEQPHLDCNSEAFVKAVYDELIEMKLTPKAARWLVHHDEDFLSDCATSYSHFCKSKEKEMAECGAPMNSFVSEEPVVDAVQELDEIARLAGLAPKMEAKCSSCGCADCKCNEDLASMAPSDSASPLTHTCEQCGMMEDKCSCTHESMVDESAINEAATRKDFRAVAELLKNIEDAAKRTELALHHAEIFKEQNPRFKKEMFLAAAGVDTTPIEDEEVVVDEAEVEEGNEFSGALAKAKAAGEKEFEVDGKKYTVKEDINLNVSATGEEDVVNLIRKLSGMPVVAIQAQPAMAEEVVSEADPKERDIEHTNTPREEVAGTNAAIPSGTDLNRAKKSYSDKPFRGDNPMSVAESKEEALWKSYENMIKDVKA